MKKQIDTNARGHGLALVTGARQGIGKAVALALAESGFDVLVNDLPNDREVQPDPIVDVRDRIRSFGRESEIRLADIARPEGRQDLVDFAVKRFGGIHCLVNNAGVAPLVRDDILSTTEESWDRVLSINLKGTFFLTQTAAREMLRMIAEGDSRRFTIVFVTSISAYTSSTTRPEYCISKAGLSMMNRLFADRLSESGVRVYEIRPGIIETGMTRGVKEKYDRLIEDGLTPIRRWGRPEDVARAVTAVVSGAFDFSTGDAFNVDGGFHLRRL